MHCNSKNSGRNMQNENKQRKQRKQKTVCRLDKNTKSIHTWIKFFLKIKYKLHTTIFILLSFCAETLYTNPSLFCRSSFSLKWYNMRLLPSDSSQVQSGMLLVCNGICSKFHGIPLGSIKRGFFFLPLPFFSPLLQLVLTAKSNRDVSY